MLNTSKMIERKKPMINVGTVIGREVLGIKNPITLEAAMILEVSAKYLERLSI